MFRKKEEKRLSGTVSKKPKGVKSPSDAVHGNNHGSDTNGSSHRRNNKCRSQSSQVLSSSTSNSSMFDSRKNKVGETQGKQRAVELKRRQRRVISVQEPCSRKNSIKGWGMTEFSPSAEAYASSSQEERDEEKGRNSLEKISPSSGNSFGSYSNDLLQIRLALQRSKATASLATHEVSRLREEMERIIEEKQALHATVTTLKTYCQEQQKQCSKAQEKLQAMNVMHQNMKQDFESSFLATTGEHDHNMKTLKSELKESRKLYHRQYTVVQYATKTLKHVIQHAQHYLITEPHHPKAELVTYAQILDQLSHLLERLKEVLDPTCESNPDILLSSTSKERAHQNNTHLLKASERLTQENIKLSAELTQLRQTLQQNNLLKSTNTFAHEVPQENAQPLIGRYRLAIVKARARVKSISYQWEQEKIEADKLRSQLAYYKARFHDKEKGEPLRNLPTLQAKPTFAPPFEVPYFHDDDDDLPKTKKASQETFVQGKRKSQHGMNHPHQEKANDDRDDVDVEGESKPSYDVSNVSRNLHQDLLHLEREIGIIHQSIENVVDVNRRSTRLPSDESD